MTKKGIYLDSKGRTPKGVGIIFRFLLDGLKRFLSQVACFYSGIKGFLAKCHLTLPGSSLVQLFTHDGSLLGSTVIYVERKVLSTSRQFDPVNCYAQFLKPMTILETLGFCVCHLDIFDWEPK